MKKLTLLITAAAVLALLALPGAALARSHDRNHDGIPDKWEKHFHLSLKKNDAKGDPDHDGLRNKGEFKAGTNPRDADTDNDGLRDGQEIRTANDPTDRDTDNNGVEDAEENGGTIASFDSSTGMLVINLAGGGTVSGQVTSATRIECRTAREQEAENENEAGDDSRATAARDGGSDSSGSGSDGGSGDRSGSDNSGPGSTSSGPGDGTGNTSTCGTADLIPNTVVHEAELEGTTFEKVELIK
jgi:hypothetical protein